MLTHRAGRAGTTEQAGRAGSARQARLARRLPLLMLCLLAFSALPARPALAASPAPAGGSPVAASPQVPFEQAIGDLSSADASTRLRAATLLKGAAYPEAAIPLAKAVADSQDAIQLEAIAAELNIFLANKVVPTKRVGLVIEVRNKIAAESAFSSGPLALGATPVPPEVLAALRTAARDDNPRVGLEALYAFGALAAAPVGAARQELQRSSGPELAALIGTPDEALRLAAVRVIGRVFEKRRQDQSVDTSVGDAIITALNENNRLIKRAAMDALGAMRYGRAVDALTQLFNFYGRGEFAEAALDALARIGHPTSIPLFVAQLSSKVPAVRGIAIEGLARAGDAGRMADIETALKGERNDSVLLAGDFAAALLSNGTIERITDALLRPKLRDVSKQYLIEIVPGRVGRLTRYVQEPDPRMRADMADILGLAGDPAGLSVVEAMVKDRDDQVGLAAQRAVGRLRNSDSPGDR
jgi:HEAT repeat protein